jgi:hypothetical protein
LTPNIHSSHDLNRPEAKYFLVRLTNLNIPGVSWTGVSLGTLVPGSFGNIDQRILGRSIAAEIALHSREAGEVTRENAAMKKLAAQFNSVP